MAGRHRAVLGLVGVVGLVVLATAAWWVAAASGSRHQDLSADPGLPSAPGRSAAPLTPQAAQQLSAALAAGTEAALASAVALPAGQTLDPSALLQIQALGPVTFDTATFHDDHDGTATVTAHLKSPAAGSNAASAWTVHLIDAGGQWKISLTEPAA